MPRKSELPTPPVAELLDHLDDVVAWTKDRAGRYTWVNRAFLLEYDAVGPRDRAAAGVADPIGKTDYDLSPAFLADQYSLDDEHVLAGHRLVNRIELVGSSDGVAVWNVTNKIPLLDARGEIFGTAGITRRLDGTSADAASHAEFGPVLAYMRDHYATPITNNQLARLVHLSVRAFERKFSATFHLTPQKYLRRLQMRLASRALVTTDQPLAEVAHGCGFADQSHFSREFRRHFGRTPREYRAHYAAGGENAALRTNNAAGVQSRRRRGR